MNTRRYLYASLVAVLLAESARAVTFAPTLDAWIRDEGTPGPADDFVREGDWISVFSTPAGPPQRYGLLQFDVSSLAGQKLLSASLDLFTASSSSNGFPVVQQAFVVDTSGGTPFGGGLNYSQYVSEYEGTANESPTGLLGKYNLPTNVGGQRETSLATQLDLAAIEAAANSTSGMLNLALKMQEDGSSYRVDWGDGNFGSTPAALNVNTLEDAPLVKGGETLEWRNNSSTAGWEIFTTTPGDPNGPTGRLAIRENEDLMVLARDDGAALYGRGAGGATSPEFGPTGVDDSSGGATVTDVSTDDAHVSVGPPGYDNLRVQFTADGSVFEIVGGALGDVIAVGPGHTAGEIANLQDRYWSIQNGQLTSFERGANPWEQDLAPTDQGGLPYIDVTMVSQSANYRVLALTESGIDEYAWDEGSESLFFVDSYLDLFADATGISIDGDQDIVYVSSLQGLYSLERDLGGSGGFLTSGLSIIDGTRPYLDVDVPRADARPIGSSAIVFAVAAPLQVVPEPATSGMVCLLLMGLVARRRRRSS